MTEIDYEEWDLSEPPPCDPCATIGGRERPAEFYLGWPAPGPGGWTPESVLPVCSRCNDYFGTLRGYLIAGVNAGTGFTASVPDSPESRRAMADFFKAIVDEDKARFLGEVEDFVADLERAREGGRPQ